MKSGRSALIAQIDALLPQTQCTRCGFEGCGPYAEAIASGRADINRCPPGGEAGIRSLAQLLGRPYRSLDPACGIEQPRHVAVVDEAQCIGCTLCLQACPVDAILGAPKQMHTVIAELCSGCELCVAPCPVDCIAMLPATGDDALWDVARACDARRRFEARKLRRERDGTPAIAETEGRRDATIGELQKRATIQAAIQRASARRAALGRVARIRERKES